MLNVIVLRAYNDAKYRTRLPNRALSTALHYLKYPLLLSHLQLRDAPDDHDTPSFLTVRCIPSFLSVRHIASSLLVRHTASLLVCHIPSFLSVRHTPSLHHYVTPPPLCCYITPLPLCQYVTQLPPSVSTSHLSSML